MISNQIRRIIQEGVNFSDVLVKDGAPFQYRIPKGLTTLDSDLITSEQILAFMTDVHGEPADEYLKLLQDNGGHLDFAITFEGQRFRSNMFWFGGSQRLGFVLRKLSSTIPSVEDLNIPPYIVRFAERSTGLVLITGATGSGKSTTLAALIDYINRKRSDHIITLEDPIEYVHQNKSSSITQREVGADVQSFHTGLSAALREDPDVILIGEIRDRVTAEAALTAAETGHLVFSTLHTTSASKTVERLLDFFEGSEKATMQSVIASVLAGVVSQILIPDRTMQNRVMVSEIMGNNPAIAAQIRKGQLQQLPNEIIQSTKEGMQLLNKELVRLVHEQTITKETALYATYDGEGLLRELSTR